jgi:hypothetical protein
MKKNILFLSLLISFGAPHLAFCFPEMVRHGYINCNTCHVSPDGGGLLTPYGRELSREILPTWGTTNTEESKFAYGLVTPPDWLNAMGMYRGVYAYQNTPFISQGQYIYMQGDAEASATFQQFTLDATLGYQDKTGDTSALDQMLSRRHYLKYQPTDQLEFRFGRFMPAFGINTPDHVIPTKSDLGWNEGQETYNLEVAWVTDTWSLFATGIFGKWDGQQVNQEQGFALRPGIALGDTYKVGLSYEYGMDPGFNRNVIGPWGILGFTKHFFLLTEWDAQQTSGLSTGAGSHWGGVDYNRLDYEFVQGLHGYVTQDFSELNFNDFSTLHNSYGVGVQFFPRPHFEINASYQRLRQIFVGNAYTDFAWLMINVYI